MKIIIVGGGICGLATAIALDRVGIESLVLEKSSDLAAEGAAISIWNNGLQALGRLRLKTDWSCIFAPVHVLHVITSRGKHLGAIPVSKLANAFGPGVAMVYRPELIELLGDNLRPGQIEFGAELVAAETGAKGITAVLADGRRIRGDLLIGADGIRGKTKQIFTPGNEAYCRHSTWRGITQFNHPFFPPGEGFSVIGQGAYFVANHVPGGRLFWAGTRVSAKPRPLERSTWKNEAAKWFADWIEPVRALIDATPESAILLNDIYSCRTPDFAVRRNSVLLGDAAHASAPQLGQGGCLALEDAVIFADCLRRDSWPHCGPRFVQLRQNRVKRVVVKSQTLADQYHLKAAIFVWLRNAIMRSVPASVRLRKAGWAARVTLPILM